jgi:DNA excision repair protein ERCC-4
MNLTSMLLVDSREKRPLAIRAYPTRVERLEVGDYGILGFSSWDNPQFVVERKSVPDLVQSLTGERERFWRECEKLRQFKFAGLVVEGREDDIRLHNYRGLANPQSILGSLAAIAVRCGIHVFWAGDPAGAAETVERLARVFLHGIEKDFQRLTRACETGGKE